MGELQAAVYAKLRIQGRLRALARGVSYLIPLCGFFAITRMYQWGRCTASESNINIVAMLMYTLVVQDPVVNSAVQYFALRFGGKKGTRFHTAMMTVVLKEVKEILWEETRQDKVLPANSTTAEILRSLSSFAYRQDPAPMLGENKNSSATMVLTYRSDPADMFSTGVAPGQTETLTEKRERPGTRAMATSEENRGATSEFEVRRVFVRRMTSARSGEVAGGVSSSRAEENESEDSRINPRARSVTDNNVEVETESKNKDGRNVRPVTAKR